MKKILFVEHVDIFKNLLLALDNSRNISDEVWVLGSLSDSRFHGDSSKSFYVGPNLKAFIYASQKSVPLRKSGSIAVLKLPTYSDH